MNRKKKKKKSNKHLSIGADEPNAFAGVDLVPGEIAQPCSTTTLTHISPSHAHSHILHCDALLIPRISIEMLEDAPGRKEEAHAERMLGRAALNSSRFSRFLPFSYPYFFFSKQQSYY
jgi:hypothetical protein